MPPTVTLHIHPAIGIARVGPSPGAWYLGPETDGEPPPPLDGFRDAAGLLKPQAARFRVIARIESGDNVDWQEVTTEIADLAWTVTLRNRKVESLTEFLSPLKRNQYVTKIGGKAEPAATATAGTALALAYQNGVTTPPQEVVAQLTFKKPVGDKDVQYQALVAEFAAAGKVPGPVDDPQLKKIADALGIAADDPSMASIEQKSLPLGRVQAEASGRLVVIGSRGIAGSASELVAAKEGLLNLADNFLWYDDTGDGPVKATIKLKPEVAAAWGLAPTEVSASPAWVVVAPPNFGQVVPPLISALDVLEGRLASNGGLEASGLLPDVILGTPAVFERDILPLLRAGYELRWANSEATAAKSHEEFLSPQALAKINYTGPDPAAKQFAADLRLHVLASLNRPGLPGAFLIKYAAVLAEAGKVPIKAKMPPSGYGDVTRLQFARMVQWAAGDFVLSSPAAVEPLPGVLDRAALRWATAVTIPGIEIGPAIRSVELHAVQAYGDQSWLAPPQDRYRLRADTQPGVLTGHLSVPWHTDFSECKSWASERPVNVFLPTQVASPSDFAPAAMVNWHRGADTKEELLKLWSQLGVLRRIASGEVVETDRTLPEPSGLAAIGFVDNQTTAIDFGTVRVGLFAGQPVRTFASRVIALTGSPAPVKSSVIALSLDGATSIENTLTGWAIGNNTVVSNGAPPTPTDAQGGWQQLFHMAPSPLTASAAKDPAALVLIYGTAVPDAGPIAEIWTMATALVQANAGNNKKIWSIPVSASTSNVPPPGVAVGIDGTALMGPDRYAAAQELAVMLALLAAQHQQVAVFRFGAKLETLAILESASAALATKQLQEFKLALAEPYAPAGDVDLAAAAAYGAGLLVGEGPSPVVLLTRGSTTQTAIAASGLPADVRLFAVGFDTDLGPLSTLTAPTGGYALQVATATPQVAFKLAGLLMTDALDLQTVLDPLVVVSSSSSAIVPFPVSSADEAIEVRCYSERAAELDGQILAPNGLVIASDKLDVQRVDGAVVLRFWPARAVDGLFPPSFSTGQWSAWFSRSSASPATSVVRRPAGPTPPVSPVVAQVAVAAASHAQLDVVLLADPADPARALLSVGVRLFGAPVAAADVTVTVHGPAGTSRPDVARRHDVWLAALVAPAAGAYEIHVRVTSWAHDGSEFQREAVRMWSVAALRR